MKQLDQNQIKKIELDILLEFRSFCDKNNLKYYLAYGTLIGAVRHKGFIPWDDDIDVHMTRKDYDWLLNNYNKMNSGGRYKIISPNDVNSYHTFIKFIDTYTIKKEQGVCYKGDFLGIDIDVFPLDGEPTDEKDFESWYNKLMKIYRYYSICNIENKGSLKKRLGVPLIRFVTGGKKRLIARAKRMHLQYPYETSDYIGSVESAYNSKGNRFEKNWFDKSIDVEFEGHMLKVPAEYDKVLTILYGDYMKLPPIDKQISHHKNVMYIKDGYEI